MRIAAIMALGLAMLLSGCGGGGKQPAVYTCSRLPLGSGYVLSDAWFVNNSGRVYGVVSGANDSTHVCCWEASSATPMLLDIPEDRLSRLDRWTWDPRTVWGTFPRVTNNDRAIFSTETGGGVVNLLTGVTVMLQCLPGTDGLVPNAVNDEGICVGTCFRGGDQTVDDCVPVVWSANGRPRQLTLPSGCRGGRANGISNSGLIVGTVTNVCPYYAHPIISNLDGSVARQIPLTQPQEQMSVDAGGVLVSDSGDILMTQPTWNPTRWCRVSPSGRVVELASYLEGGWIGGMNSRGQIAGNDRNGDPVIWNPDGSVVKLPPLSAGVSCEPKDISDDGVVVGTALPTGNPGQPIAIIWTPNP